MHTTPATALTIVGFLTTVGLLSSLPGVPDELRPLRLDTQESRVAVAKKVLQRPKMTLAEHEQRLEGHVAMPDVPDDSAEGADDEDKALFDESRAAADVVALAVIKSDAPPAAEAEQAAPPVDRRMVVSRADVKKAQRLRATHQQLKMPGAAVDNPCVVSGEDGCDKTAMDALFSTFDAIARGDDDARAEIVILGNSLIASDHVTDILRDRTQAALGNGGRGFLLPERLVKGVGRRVRTGQGSEDWIVHHFAKDPPWGKDVRFGFTGSLYEASKNGEHAAFTLDGATVARAFWQDTGKGFVLEVDGKPWLTVPDGEATFAAMDKEVRLPPLSKTLTLKAQKGARVYGVQIERDVRGVVVDTIGVPASSTKLYTQSIDRELFVQQLRALRPTLNVVMLGGNETRALAFGTLDDATFEARLTSMLEAMREAAPEASCLLVSPIDAGKTTTSDDTLVTREEIHRVIAVQKKVAADMGCAMFDIFAAMGGAGSLQRMREQKLVSDDLVHPTARGGDVLGQLLADAVLRAYQDTPAQSDRLAHRRPRQEAHAKGPRYAGLSFPNLDKAGPVIVGREETATVVARPEPLSRFFARLDGLDDGSVRRVAIGQFGASHTAGQTLTDRMRARLADRYGGAGRGFVATGTPSKRLAPSGVVRDVIGAFDIADGRDAVKNGALGMAGMKTRLQPGARFKVGFCAGCPAPNKGFDDEAGQLELAWLYTPDMGTADILVDGERVAVLTPQTRRRESDVQFLRLPITHEKATLEVIARKDSLPSTNTATGETPTGPVHLLGVVEEMDRKGVVLDAIGLPGSTGMTPQRWRQDLYAEEVQRRRYDLIITAWGTNEAGIASLDENTYRHHFGATLTTLQDASPEADCLIVGASDRFDHKAQGFVSAPSHDLVERVQKELAAAHGCAFFSMRDAMGGPGSMKQWVEKGLGHTDHVHFKTEGYKKLADMIVDDLELARAHRKAVERAVP